LQSVTVNQTQIRINKVDASLFENVGESPVSISGGSRKHLNY